MAPPKKGDLSPEEKDLLGVIAAGNTEEAGRLLGSKNVRVNCLDECGIPTLAENAQILGLY